MLRIIGMKGFIYNLFGYLKDSDSDCVFNGYVRITELNLFKALNNLYIYCEKTFEEKKYTNIKI